MIGEPIVKVICVRREKPGCNVHKNQEDIDRASYMFVRLGLAVTAVGAAVTFRRQQLHEREAGNRGSSSSLSTLLIDRGYSLSSYATPSTNLCLMHKNIMQSQIVREISSV